MKIWAMLSFFNEDEALLRESVSRVCALGVDVVAVADGPYDLYPSETDHSPISSWRGITSACEKSSVQWLGWSKGAWKAGNEVEKRNFLLSKVLERAEEGDWLLVFDSDHMWERVEDNWPHELRDFLSAGAHQIEGQVAEVSFADCLIDDPEPSWYEACLLYRAVPGMAYVGSHWRIRFPDGSISTTLRTEQEKHTARTLDLREHFRVRHTVFDPEMAERRKRQTTYYEGRDAGEGVER